MERKLGWVDKTLTPLLGWRMTKAKHLVYWVEQRGEMRECNANVWATNTPNSLKLDHVENIRNFKSHTGVDAKPQIFAEKANLEVVKSSLNRLEQIVVKLEPGVVELTMTIGRFERSIWDFHGDAFDKIVSEVLRVRGENTSNNCPSILSTR